MRRTLDPITLRLFVAVCEERNIARAAAREAIVASAVSKRIAALEQAVGAALVVRGLAAQHRIHRAARGEADAHFVEGVGKAQAFAAGQTMRRVQRHAQVVGPIRQCAHAT